MQRPGLILLAAVALGLAPKAHADPSWPGSSDPPRETPFVRGRFGFSGGDRQQTAFGHRYISVGLGAGYYVHDGLEVGLFALHEFGDAPSINELSPSLRYVAQPLVGRWPLLPYAGVFYNHWFIGAPGSDQDTVGTRAGLLYLSGRAVLGLGVVYEHVVSTCPGDCDSVYPDVTIVFAL